MPGATAGAHSKMHWRRRLRHGAFAALTAFIVGVPNHKESVDWYNGIVADVFG
jgi:hypothetical protein